MPVHQGVLSKATVDGHTRSNELQTELLSARQTEFAVKARLVDPWNTDDIAWLQMIFDVGAELNHFTDTFMARNTRQERLKEFPV